MPVGGGSSCPLCCPAHLCSFDSSSKSHLLPILTLSPGASCDFPLLQSHGQDLGWLGCVVHPDELLQPLLAGATTPVTPCTVPIQIHCSPTCLGGTVQTPDLSALVFAPQTRPRGPTYHLGLFPLLSSSFLLL